MTGDRIDGLLTEYRNQLRLPWSRTIAGPQRVWMVVYDPDLERRLRLRLGEFEIETRAASRRWELVDLTTAFADWLAANEYREAYFKEPELLGGALGGFADSIADRVRAVLAAPETDESTVVAILGAGSLFPMARVSELIDRVSPEVRGRLLVFFPGFLEGSNYRLLDARDGWNYLAVPITAGG
jgi:BREX protein BrxB